MEKISLILGIISIIVTIIDILITIFGVVVPIIHERNIKKPRFILKHFFMGVRPNIEEDFKSYSVVLHGYFKSQRDFDNRLHNLLKSNDSDVMFSTDNFMRFLVESYKKKDYHNATNWHPQSEINKILQAFDKNPKLIKLINEYIAYENQSKWNLTITNVGESPAYDLTVNLFKENNGAAKYLDGTLKPNDSRNVIIYYFDKSGVIDFKNKKLYWNNDKNTIFYLIDEKKYNKKDERLFLIKYKDMYGKYHKIYCCSKIGINEEHISFGGE